MRGQNQRALLVGVTAVAVAVSTLTACGKSSQNADSRATATTTVSPPTLAAGAPQGAAVNARYWTFQMDALDPKTKEFADYEAADFCKNPATAVLKARMIPMGSYKVLALDYAVQNKEDPTWKNDVGVQTTIAWYMISNYCPEKPG